MRGRLALLVGCAIADHRAAGDQRRTVGLASLLDGGGDFVGVVTVDAARVPAGGFETFQRIARFRKRQRAVDGDAVVVVEDDQLRQFQVAGKADRLVADAFHQVAVGGQHIGVVIDDLVAETGGLQAFGQRHADRRRDALAERACRGFDTRRMTVFRMAGGDAPKLPEISNLLDRHVFIAEQIVDGVEQHRAVARRQHEAVAVGPVRRARVDFQETGEEDRRDVGRAHRHARVTGIGLLHRVHRQCPYGVGKVRMGSRRRLSG